jgi:hypothetical protein
MLTGFLSMSASERVLLRPHAHAAEDRRRRHRSVDREIVQVLHDLRRELASGRKHQGAGGAARFVDQAVKDRQHKRRGLATACHGAGEYVPAGERGWHGVGLDRRGPGEAELLYALEETGMELERSERQTGSLDGRIAGLSKSAGATGRGDEA